MSFQPQYIAPIDMGLTNNVKPFMLLDGALQRLFNAYCWRGRVKKREGILLIGRLRRIITSQAAGNVTFVSGTTTFNIFTQLGITGENPNLELGSITPITLVEGPGLSQTWTDSTGTGVMTGFAGLITAVSINYSTGNVIVQGTFAGVVSLTVSAAYYPGLPVMGIEQREIATVNNEQTILFDTKYAYQYLNQRFQELTTPGTTWSGTDINFFWSTNWRGSTPDARLFFATNFVNDAADPISYFDGTSWNPFIPVLGVSGGLNTYLTQALILIPYYGRLLALNVWETPADPMNPANPLYGSSVNIFNRCRFSAIGSPIAANAWRTDIQGQGGFIDAPVNEIITSAQFFKNTLIVFFERSSWILRYVGEFGLPFLWERISSDFGSESTFAPILFDQGVLSVADRAIITCSGNDVQRIDLQIPDEVFNFKDTEQVGMQQLNSRQRIQGIRNFQKEVVYWAYPDGQLNRKFPNFNLVYNYRNQTYAIFRNNVTAFGNLNSPTGISWDSLDVSWDDLVPWDSFIQTEFNDTISGNQQGYIHFFGDPNSETISDSVVPAIDQESLYISAVDRSQPALTLTVNNHNLETGEIVYITGMVFVNTTTGTPITTSLNNQLYSILYIDANTFSLLRWDFNAQQYVNNFAYTPANGTGTYMGGGNITLFPVLDIITKDFNPFTSLGLQCKFGHMDLLTDATPNSAVTVQLFNNASLSQQTNLTVGNKQSSTSLTAFGTITNITTATNAVLTSQTPHGLKTGDMVVLGNIQGLTNLNGYVFTITVVDVLNFQLNTDTTAFPAYTAGTLANWIQSNFPFYTKGSQYAWHRFYAGVQGSFFAIRLTYDDNLMNTFTTHQQDFQLNAIRTWTRKGGMGVFG